MTSETAPRPEQLAKNAVRATSLQRKLVPMVIGVGFLTTTAGVAGFLLGTPGPSPDEESEA